MEELLTRVRKKDKEAVALLYNRYGRKLYGYGVSKWHLEEDDAWDLVYKTLYRVMQVSDKYTFEDEKKFSGFLFTTFINYLRNHYRDNKNKGFETVEMTEKHERTLSQGEGESSKQSPSMICLQKALNEVGDWQRVVLLMRAQDFSYEEIAKYVSKPAEQLKVYYMRLKKAVTELVNECLGMQKQ